MYFTIPERRKDTLTRETIDALLVTARRTQQGLMLYADLRPQDTRTHDLMVRCDTEIAYLVQLACTLTERETA